MATCDDIPSKIPEPPTIRTSIQQVVEESEFKRSERVGYGAKSEVYKKTLPEGTSIAIKLPRGTDTISGEFAEDTIKEAKKWAMFDHDPYVVSLFDYGVSKGQPWIAMEYMDGDHLGHVLEQEGIQSLKHGIWLSHCIASGLDTAHGRGVAHRDIKPKNVLFRRVESGWDVPKVGDWGTATTLLEPDETVGDYTPRYAAPEQHTTVVYSDFQKRIDIYQLGLMMYVIFAGEHPFGRSTETALTDEPTPPSEIRPGLPTALESLIMTCLKRAPEDRFRDARPVRRKLDAFLEQFE